MEQPRALVSVNAAGEHPASPSPRASSVTFLCVVAQPCGNTSGDGTGNVAFKCVTVCRAHWFEVPACYTEALQIFKLSSDF